MRDVTFYRAWLLTPVAIPLVLALLGPITPSPPEPWLTVLVYLMLSVPFGALPYLLCVALLWRWLPGQRPARVRAVALVLPLPMLAFNAVAVHAPWQLVVAITYGWVTVFLVSDVVVRALRLVRPGPRVSSGQLT